MKNNNLIIFLIIGVVVLGVGGYFIFGNKTATAPTTTNQTTSTSSGSETSGSPQIASNPDTSNGYQDYTEEAFAAASGKRRVYFFHAPWCPTCRPANREFEEREDEIPEDVVLFKTDYDTSTSLKNKYGVTYQHTFVQVGENGNEVAKWNGGGLRELLSNLK